MDGGIRPVAPSMKVAGPAFTVRCYPGATFAIEKALELAQPGDVLGFETLCGQAFQLQASALTDVVLQPMRPPCNETERQQWLKLTDEAFPRLSIVRQVADDGATYFGPFSRREAAELGPTQHPRAACGRKLQNAVTVGRFLSPGQAVQQIGGAHFLH